MCLAAGFSATALWAKFHPMSPWAKMMFLSSLLATTHDDAPKTFNTHLTYKTFTLFHEKFPGQ